MSLRLALGCPGVQHSSHGLGPAEDSPREADSELGLGQFAGQVGVLDHVHGEGAGKGGKAGSGPCTPAVGGEMQRGLDERPGEVVGRAWRHVALRLGALRAR